MPRKKNRAKVISDETKRILIEEIKKRNVEIEEKNIRIAQLKKEVTQFQRRWEGLNHFIRVSSDYKMGQQVKWLTKEYARVAANNRTVGKVVDGCAHCSHMLNSMNIQRLDFSLE